MAFTAALSQFRAKERVDWWQYGVMALLLAVLTAFILYPVLRVLWRVLILLLLRHINARAR